MFFSPLLADLAVSVGTALHAARCQREAAAAVCGGSAHVASSVDWVVILSSEFLVDNRRQSGLEHRLEGFFQVGVPATGAHLTMSDRPVPGALKIPGNSPFAVASSD